MFGIIIIIIIFFFLFFALYFLLLFFLVIIKMFCLFVWEKMWLVYIYMSVLTKYNWLSVVAITLGVLSSILKAVDTINKLLNIVDNLFRTLRQY